MRRTRVLRTPQSHGGCFSCKTRKVKCDMVKPICGRCIKAKRVCEGYEDRPEANGVVVYACSKLPAASLSPSASVSPDVISSSPYGGTLDFYKFANLGCTVLHRGSLRQQSSAQSFWSVTLPQLGRSDLAVGASMAALGAAVEFSLNSKTEAYLSYVRQYGYALKQIQEIVASTSTVPSVSSVAACLLVAVSEVVVGQEPNALAHLIGALTVLQHRHRLIETSTKCRVKDEGTTCNADEDYVLLDEVDLAGAVIDLGTATYQLAREPRLPRPSTSRLDSDQAHTKSLPRSEFRVLETLHDSYRFASKHFQWRYVNHQLAPIKMYTEQSRFTGQLFQRIQELRDLRSSLDPASKQTSRALTLTAQCTSCLIYLSVLFDPFETAYDKFAASFRSIVEDAEIVVSQQSASNSEGSISISLDLGVNQPLFFTAMKYRDPEIRRKAIRLLELGGREGAWDGKLIALAARRAVEVEEQATGLDESVPDGMPIAERHRLHGVGLGGIQPTQSDPRVIDAWFSKCKDIEMLMATISPDEYTDERHWEVWHEKLPRFPADGARTATAKTTAYFGKPDK